MEKKNSATMLEEARKREDSLYDDATELEVCFVILIGCSFTCPVAIKSQIPSEFADMYLIRIEPDELKILITDAVYHWSNNMFFSFCNS